MKKAFPAAFLLALGLAPAARAQAPLPPPTQAVSDADFRAKILADTLYIQQHYAKMEYQIAMRDGVKLYTEVYVPRDADRVRYPIMLSRTPYSARPYGPGKYRVRISPNSQMLHEGYILAFQDLRGRYMSEGVFEGVRPQLPPHAPKTAIDESTDTFDTIEFLTKKGPRLLVQVQSTWFPLVDRNPQTYVPNIFEANEADFKAQTHQLYHNPAHASQLVVKVLPPMYYNKAPVSYANRGLIVTALLALIEFKANPGRGEPPDARPATDTNLP